MPFGNLAVLSPLNQEEETCRRTEKIIRLCTGVIAGHYLSYSLYQTLLSVLTVDINQYSLQPNSAALTCGFAVTVTTRATAHRVASGRVIMSLMHIFSWHAMLKHELGFNIAHSWSWRKKNKQTSTNIPSKAAVDHASNY